MQARWARAVVWLSLAGLVLTVACSRRNREHSSATDDLRRGDWLVVEQTAAEFFKARVLVSERGRIKIQRSVDGTVLEVGESDTYRLVARPPRLGSGSFAICEIALERWVACRIVRNLPGGFIVADTNETEHRVSELQVLEPTGLTTLNIRRRFEDVARRRTFQQSIRSAGVPRRSSDFSPTPERLVLAERTGQWFGARVVTVNDERVVLRWDGQGETSEVNSSELGPQPPACGTAARGERALRRPEGYGAPWEAVLVISADGFEVTVEDIDRNRAVVSARDLCPLGEARADSGH